MTRIFERAGVTAGTEVVMRLNQYFYSLDNMLRNESDSRDRYMFPHPRLVDHFNFRALFHGLWNSNSYFRCISSLVE